MSQKVPGYRKKPAWIYVISTLYFLSPLLILAQFYVKVDHSLPFLRQIMVSDFFLMELFGAWSAALAILIVSRISFLYYLTLSFYTIGVKLYNLRFNSLFEYPFDFIVLAFWFLITLLFLFTTLKVPYLNPQARWWTQPKRLTSFALGTIMARGIKFPIVTLNISSTGLFVKLDERAINSVLQSYKTEGSGEEKRKAQALGKLLLSPEELDTAARNLPAYPAKLGEKTIVQIQTIPAAASLFPKGLLEASAEVVWATKPGSKYRCALGLRFIDQTSADKKKFQAYVHLLNKAGCEEEKRQ